MSKTKYEGEEGEQIHLSKYTGSSVIPGALQDQAASLMQSRSSSHRATPSPRFPQPRVCVSLRGIFSDCLSVSFPCREASLQCSKNKSSEDERVQCPADTT
ncbi:uncharacterized [Tachysurus ichikawai]